MKSSQFIKEEVVGSAGHRERVPRIGFRSGSSPGEICLELIERAGEALLHRGVHALVHLLLRLGGVDRSAMQAERGLSVPLGQGHDVEDFERPVRAERRPGDAAIGIGEGGGEHQPLGCIDLAIGEAAPPCLARLHVHRIEEDAARPEVQLLDGQLAALRPPPLRQPFGFGPGFPHQFARCGERAADVEVLLLVRDALACLGHRRSPCVAKIEAGSGRLAGQHVREAPGVAERIDHLAIAGTPERVPRLLQDLGARVHGARDGCVAVLDLEMQHHRGALQFLRGHDLVAAGAVRQVGEIIDQENPHAVDREIGMHQALAVFRRHPQVFGGAERLLVELDGLDGAANDEMGCDALQLFGHGRNVLLVMMQVAGATEIECRHGGMC